MVLAVHVHESLATQQHPHPPNPLPCAHSAAKPPSHAARQLWGPDRPHTACEPPMQAAWPDPWRSHRPACAAGVGPLWRAHRGGGPPPHQHAGRHTQRHATTHHSCTTAGSTPGAAATKQQGQALLLSRSLLRPQVAGPCHARPTTALCCAVLTRAPCAATQEAGQRARSPTTAHPRHAAQRLRGLHCPAVLATKLQLGRGNI
jgi:hypothetical protein